jgi:hypothetical protein
METRRVSPELRFEEVHYRVYRGARLEADGHAARAAYRRETAAVEANVIESLFPPTPGRDAVRATAAEGEGSLRTRDFTGWGGLTLDRGGDVAVTEAARYSGSDEMIRGDRPITVKGRAYTLEGPGFGLDPRTGELTIDGGARLVAGRRHGR